MPHCFAPGCKSGYSRVKKDNKELGIKNVALFGAPKDEELLKKWIVAVRRKDKILTPNDKVCEKHFTEDCIIRTYETILRDGSVWNYERGSLKLKPGAIPTIFAHSPNPTLKKRNRKSSTAKAFMPKKQEIASIPRIQTFMPLKRQEITRIPNVSDFIESEYEEIAPIHIDSNHISSDNEVISQIPVLQTFLQSENEEIAPITINPTHIGMENQEIAPISIVPTFIPSDNEEIAPIPVENLVEDKFLAYETLLSELDTVIKPNDLWVISHNSNFIICAKWDSNCTCERYVIILKDFSVKIFLRNKEIAISDVTVIKDIDDLSVLLMKVDKLIILEDL